MGENFKLLVKTQLFRGKQFSLQFSYRTTVCRFEQNTCFLYAMLLWYIYEVGNPKNIQAEGWIFSGKIDRGQSAQNF